MCRCNDEKYTKYVKKEFGVTINFADEPSNKLIASDIKYAVDVAGWYWRFGLSWGDITLLADRLSNVSDTTTYYLKKHKSMK